VVVVVAVVVVVIMIVVIVVMVVVAAVLVVDMAGLAVGGVEEVGLDVGDPVQVEADARPSTCSSGTLSAGRGGSGPAG
jgi:hypothetical protein